MSSCKGLTDTSAISSSQICPSDGLPAAKRTLAMVTIAISLTLAILDGAIANVALPLISADLRAADSTAIWVVNGYQLALAICLLPFATLGETLGYRNVYRSGLVLFTLASIACALSGSMTALTVSRVVQGIGAAGIMSVNTALIRYIVSSAKLGSAVGLNALVAATASTIGPTIAGAILSVATWPWLFAINLPLGIAAIALAARNLPDNERSKSPFDYLSAILSAAMIGTLVTTVESFGHGVSQVWVAAQFALCVSAGVLLMRRESGALRPFFPFDLLRIPVLRLSLATSVSSFGAQMIALVSLPFMLHHEFGFGPATIGLLMTPWPLMVAVISPIAGRLSDRISPGLLGGVGLCMFSLGLLALGLLPTKLTPLDIVWRMMLCGIGFGLFQSPNNRTLVGTAPKSRSGAASGMLGTARLTGQATGTAFVAMMLARFQTAGMRPALLTAAIIALIACAISLRRMRHHNGNSRAGDARAFAERL